MNQYVSSWLSSDTLALHQTDKDHWSWLIYLTNHGKHIHASESWFLNKVTVMPSLNGTYIW